MSCKAKEEAGSTCPDLTCDSLHVSILQEAMVRILKMP